MQLELEANPPGGRVRKIAQRDTGGWFVEPLVLPAGLPPLQVAVALEVPGAGEVVVSASWLPAGSEPAAGGGGAVEEVSRAAA